MGVDFSIPVLVVEDSNTMGRIITGYLRQIGFERVDLVAGGHSALAKMKNTPYGLVISDWNMQPMTGLELLQQVRETRSDVRFVIMTTDASMNHVIAARNAGVDHFIVKPFDVSSLKAKIDSLFQESTFVVDVDAPGSASVTAG